MTDEQNIVHAVADTRLWRTYCGKSDIPLGYLVRAADLKKRGGIQCSECLRLIKQYRDAKEPEQ